MLTGCEKSIVDGGRIYVLDVWCTHVSLKTSIVVFLSVGSVICFLQGMGRGQKTFLWSSWSILDALKHLTKLNVKHQAVQTNFIMTSY